MFGVGRGGFTAQMKKIHFKVILVNLQYVGKYYPIIELVE